MNTTWKLWLGQIPWAKRVNYGPAAELRLRHWLMDFERERWHIRVERRNAESLKALTDRIKRDRNVGRAPFGWTEVRA